jgi:tRNA1Val (adenine37-N6)-methyltransferase
MKVGTDAVLLGAWVNINKVKRILDIGTGSGIIALMIAQRTKNDVTIDAIDSVEEDYTQAIENFSSCSWNKKLKAHLCPVQEFDPPYRYDLIVSNPP